MTNLRWLVVLFATGCLLAQPALAHCCAAFGSGAADVAVDEADCPTHLQADTAALTPPTVDAAPTIPALHCDGSDAMGGCDVVADSPWLANLRTEVQAGDAGVDFAPGGSAAHFPGAGAPAPRLLAWLPAPHVAGREHLLLTQRWRL